MKNNELQNLLSGLNAVSNLKGSVFSYGVGKNAKKITSTLNNLYSKQVFNDDFQEFQKQKLELLESLAMRDEEDKPIQIDTPQGKSYKFEDDSAVNEAVDILIAEHQDAIDAQKVHDEDFNKLLDQDTDFEIHLVKLSNVPEDITGGQISAIMEMIVDD